MTPPGLNVERWVLRRQIDMPRTAVSHNLLPGRVYVLVDEAGANIDPYIQFLGGTAKREDENKLTLEWNGESQPRTSWVCAGFSDTFPAGSTTTSFLQSAGVSQSEIAKVLSAYDLSRYAYSTCAQLSVTAQRQLSLIAALRSSAKILVLNDPFQPFSGRWREQFAEEILEDAKQKQRCVIICNLSFMPQFWLEKPLVSKIDVQALALEAINRAIGIEEEQKRRAAQKAAEAAKAQAAAEKSAANAVKLDDKLIQEAEKSVPELSEEGVPAPLHFMYKHVRDFIFEPLAELSTFLRSWSGAIAALGFVALTVSMAYVFVPALGTSNASFANFAREWNKGEVPADKQIAGVTKSESAEDAVAVTEVPTTEASGVEAVDWTAANWAADNWSGAAESDEGAEQQQLARWNYIPRLMAGEDRLLLDSCELE